MKQRLSSGALLSMLAGRVVRVIVAVSLSLAALSLLISPAMGGEVYSARIPLASATLPLASPSETYMVDLGVNQAYVRGVYYGVTGGSLASADIELYFPARGLKLFIVYVSVYDADGNLLDRGLDVGFTSDSTYTMSIALAGVPLSSVDSVEVLVQCVLGC